ncbi:TIGR00153 family protein [Algicola sagamiensis]|uniref:TIGR00153 family protein n=1 Tax=Algicola sagamiensis TaxID=163869 RepID=UPI00036FFBC1|nr:TIGR00153 family protein [Algicola sagamiensis]
MPGNSFLGVFAKSPIKPLEEHMRVVHSGSKLLLNFFEAVYAEDWESAHDVQRQISKLENEADNMKREIRIHLPRGLFMSVDRSDLLELLSTQDKIGNTAKDIAGRVVGRHLTIPQDMQTDFLAYVSRNVDATAQACKAINELDDLLETGFRGREVDLVETMIEELDRLEGDTDVMQIKLRSQLHRKENELNPVDVMFLYNIIESVGLMADYAEKVGSRLEIMLAK